MMWKILLVVAGTATIIAATGTPPPNFLVPPPASLPLPRRYAVPQQTVAVTPPVEPSFFRRMASWFGLGGGGGSGGSDDTQTDYSSAQPQYREFPGGHTANSYFPDNGGNGKKPCNPCNRVPWLPMFMTGPHLPIVRVGTGPQPSMHQYHHVPGNFRQSYRPLPHHPSRFNSVGPPSRYAVVNPEYIPSANLLPVERQQHRLVPIPVPNLSVTPIPPLYNAQQFHPFPYNEELGTRSANLPSFNHNNGIISPYNFYPAANSYPSKVSTNFNQFSSQDDGVEIIPSISLGSYTASVEYPVNYEQSPYIDLTQNLPQQPHQHPIAENISVQPIAEANVVAPVESATDSYSAASYHNITVRQENRNDLDSYKTETDSSEEEETTSFIPLPDSTVNFVDNLKSSEVEIQPSLQTLNEEGARAIVLPLKKERDTPKRLLDAPILYNKRNDNPKPFTRDPSELRIVTHSNHNADTSKPISWTTSGLISLTSKAFEKSSTRVLASSTTTPMPLSTPAYSPHATHNRDSIESLQQPAFVNSVERLHVTKRPKQIQIIIPYSINHNPSPFKAIIDGVEDNGYDKASGWSTNTHDYHVPAESKVVPATEEPITKTTRYLTKILAANLREILKNERDLTSTPRIPFDIVKLQKNIDGWTEQEFADTSFTPSKSSTISLLSSKQIPDEYLTTTPSQRRYEFTTPSTTKRPLRTTTFEPLLSDQGVGSKFELIHPRPVDDNRLEIDHPRGRTTTLPAVTTRELWQKLKIAISPSTNEKVYVVTPQPLSLDSPTDVGNFKSPRFVVRPTPGIGSTHYVLGLSLPQSINNLQTISTTVKPKRSGKFTPELFGRMDSLSYHPSAVDEPIYEKTKVITFVTPSPELKSTNKHLQSLTGDKKSQPKSAIFQSAV